MKIPFKSHESLFSQRRPTSAMCPWHRGMCVLGTPETLRRINAWACHVAESWHSNHPRKNGFNGILMGINGILMGFNGITGCFNGILMGFNGITWCFNGIQWCF